MTQANRLSLRILRPAILVPALLVFSTLGCGSKQGTSPVQGKITFEGRPMAGGGRIMFIPLKADGQTADARPAQGQINADGTFRLGTNTADDGAGAGEHRVQITQNTVVKPATFKKGRDGHSQVDKPAEELPTDQKIPPVYGSPKSPVKQTVAKGPNDLEIKLVRNPKS